MYLKAEHRYSVKWEECWELHDTNWNRKHAQLLLAISTHSYISNTSNYFWKIWSSNEYVWHIAQVKLYLWNTEISICSTCECDLIWKHNGLQTWQVQFRYLEYDCVLIKEEIWTQIQTYTWRHAQREHCMKSQGECHPSAATWISNL